MIDSASRAMVVSSRPAQCVDGCKLWVRKVGHVGGRMGQDRDRAASRTRHRRRSWRAGISPSCRSGSDHEPGDQHDSRDGCSGPGPAGEEQAVKQAGRAREPRARLSGPVPPARSCRAVAPRRLRRGRVRASSDIMVRRPSSCRQSSQEARWLSTRLPASRSSSSLDIGWEHFFYVDFFAGHGLFPVLACVYGSPSSLHFLAGLISHPAL